MVQKKKFTKSSSKAQSWEAGGTGQECRGLFFFLSDGGRKKNTFTTIYRDNENCVETFPLCERPALLLTTRRNCEEIGVQPVLWN